MPSCRVNACKAETIGSAWASHSPTSNPSSGPIHATLAPAMLCATGGMTLAYRQTILEQHNKLRSTLVQASNMIKMTYDDKLETVAQNYLDKLKDGENKAFEHNSVATDDYNKLGENAKWVGENWYSGKPTDAAEKWTNFVWPVAWGGTGCSEEQNYYATYGGKIPEYAGRKYGATAPAKCKGGVTGHYTQVMWAKSTLIGCGWTKSHGTLCNYAPGGNFGDTTKYFEQGKQ